MELGDFAVLNIYSVLVPNLPVLMAWYVCFIYISIVDLISKALRDRRGDEYKDANNANARDCVFLRSYLFGFSKPIALVNCSVHGNEVASMRHET